ncbi:MAG TPA: HepT-like ribonuclease domain-containing protein [Paraburkholderia sp.]|nr:HepT-like ribonuclease domain-containing protein [Paraburkholderia sp.]
MRNRVSHGYFSVDLDIVWQTPKRDLPELQQQRSRLKRA